MSKHVIRSGLFGSDRKLLTVNRYLPLKKAKFECGGRAMKRKAGEEDRDGHEDRGRDDVCPSNSRDT